MAHRLVLWDIDGTLVRTGPAGVEAFDRAMVDVCGTCAPGRVVMSGKTDPRIVVEQLEVLGIPPTPETVAAVLERLVARLAEAAPRLAREARACPGAAAVLGALAARPDVASGCVTGNLRPNAALKLHAVGLDTAIDLTLGAYGSDHPERDALVPLARQRAAARLGTPVAADDTWVVGDTPLDLACARAGGVRCLLVATGRYSYGELRGLGADAVVSDLGATDDIVELLGGVPDLAGAG